MNLKEMLEISKSLEKQIINMQKSIKDITKEINICMENIIHNDNESVNKNMLYTRYNMLTKLRDYYLGQLSIFDNFINNKPIKISPIKENEKYDFIKDFYYNIEEGIKNLYYIKENKK